MVAFLYDLPLGEGYFYQLTINTRLESNRVVSGNGAQARHIDVNVALVRRHCRYRQCPIPTFARFLAAGCFPDFDLPQSYSGATGNKVPIPLIITATAPTHHFSFSRSILFVQIRDLTTFCNPITAM